MSRWLVSRACLVLAFLWLASGAAFAQSAISGSVRDTSGAVMPGVTVEVASPVLIEKVRSAVTDEQGTLHHRRSTPRHLRRRVHVGRVQYVPVRTDSSSPPTSRRL